MSKESYWAKGIPLEIVKTAVKNSKTYCVLSPNKKFAGFARVVTDFATFGYLADVFIIPQYQGRGLGKMLIESIMTDPDYSLLRNWLLYTKDAHALYQQFGWTAMISPERAMVIRKKPEEIYLTK